MMIKKSSKKPFTGSKDSSPDASDQSLSNILSSQARYNIPYVSMTIISTL